MKLLRWLWAMVPFLSFGMLSWLAFAFLAARRRSLPLAAAALGYFLLLCLIVSPPGQAGESLSGLGGLLMLLLWGTSTFHAFWIASGKDRNRRDALAGSLAGGGAGLAPAPPSWSPAPPPGQSGAPDALLAEIAHSAAPFNWAPVDRRIDEEIWRGLHKIVVDSWNLLLTARHKGVIGDQLIAVEMMYTDYVPSSVRAVTALAPEQLVTAEDAAHANRSAREIVDAISRELTTMMRMVASGDLSKLDEQRTFLQDRFGRSGGIQL